MNYLKNRNLIIVVIVLVLLFGGYYLTNTKKTTTSSKDAGVNTNVNLNNNETPSKTSSTSTAPEETKVSDSNISSFSPAAGITVATKPTEVSIKFSKVVRGGSEIKVASAKGVDVVPAANTLSADGKTLSAPVTITASGVYDVSYSYCLADNTCKTGSFSFTVK